MPVAAEHLEQGGAWWHPQYGVRVHEQEAIRHGHYLHTTRQACEYVQVSKWYGHECPIDADEHGAKENPNQQFCVMHSCTTEGCDQPRVNATRGRCAHHEWQAAVLAQTNQSNTIETCACDLPLNSVMPALESDLISAEDVRSTWNGQECQSRHDECTNWKTNPNDKFCPEHQ